MINALNDMMSLDGTIVRVLPGGTFGRYAGKARAPEICMQTDDDGQISRDDERAMVEYVEQQGWRIESGWTGQYGYAGPVMHASEYIGGAVMEHILSTPGLWCALPVDVESEECPNGSKSYRLSDPCVICTDGTGHDRESVSAGWAFMHRNVPVTLGVETGSGRYPMWPVLRDGADTGTWVIKTDDGFYFKAPHSVTGTGQQHRGDVFTSVDEVRRDAEEWLTENLA